MGISYNNNMVGRLLQPQRRRPVLPPSLTARFIILHLYDHHTEEELYKVVVEIPSIFCFCLEIIFGDWINRGYLSPLRLVGGSIELQRDYEQQQKKRM